MNYLQLCQKTVRDLGLQGSVSTVVSQSGMNQKIVDWVADADEEIQSIWFNWEFLWAQHSTSTVVGQVEYLAPSALGTWDVDSFYLNYTSAAYVHLAQLSYPEWRSVYRQGTQTNDEPGRFVITPTKSIYLEPRPDAVYTLTADYWKVPTRMTANNSESDIPDRFQRIIIARAKIYWSEHEEFPAVLELATMEYRDLLSRLEADQLTDRKANRFSTADLVMRVE